MTARRPSLASVLSRRLVAAACVAMLLQLVLVVTRYYLTDSDLLAGFVTQEVAVLAGSLENRDGRPSVRADRLPARYRDGAGYAFRVFDDQGVLAGKDDERFDHISPWSDSGSRIQDLWVANTRPTQKFFFAGGARQFVDGHPVWIEVATDGDPDVTFFRVIAYEVWDDVWLPIITTFGIAIAVVIFSARQSLSPLAAAARAAEELSPLHDDISLDLTKLPREAESLVLAINRLLARVRELVKANQLFISRAAHELRTPLAAMLLELDNIEHPRTTLLERDVREMSALVDRLLVLGRLQNRVTHEFMTMDLAEVAREQVERLALIASERGQTITFVEGATAATVDADPQALREAVRNLVENAIRHSPDNSIVHVSAAGTTLTVEDNGPGLPTDDLDELCQPFRRGASSSSGAGLGLAIVREAAELHGARLVAERSASLGGARLSLIFPRQ